MFYLIFDTIENARKRTQEAAIKMGCGKNSEDETTMWFGILEHPVNSSIFSLVIPESDIFLLTEDEIKLLKTHEEMTLLDWFIEKR